MGKIQVEVGMVTELQVEIDDSILLTLRENKEEFVKEMLFNNALILYRKNKLSLGKAAQMAGYDRLDFIWLLRSKGEPVFDYDDETLDDMIDGAKRTMKAVDEDAARLL